MCSKSLQKLQNSQSMTKHVWNDLPSKMKTKISDELELKQTMDLYIIIFKNCDL